MAITLKGILTNADDSAVASLSVNISQAISGITAATSAVVTLSTTQKINPFGVGTQLKFASVGGMTQINGLTGTVTAIGGSAGAWTVTVNINSSAFSAYTSGGTASVPIASGDWVVFEGSSGNSTAPTYSGASFAAITGVTQVTVGSAEGTLYAECQAAKLAGTETAFTYSTGTAGYIVGARIYSGCAASPFSVTPVQPTPAASASPPVSLAFGTMTPTAGSVLVMMCQAGMSSGTGETWTFTPPGGFANSEVHYEQVLYGQVQCSCDLIGAAGTATGTLTAQITNSVALATGLGGWLICLDASAGGTGAALAWIRA